MIAPGILCPKCKGPMLDERMAKRTDKSPDYTCANLTCVTSGTNGKSYRTAIWAEKSSGAEVPSQSAAGVGNAGNTSAPLTEGKPKMRDAYKSLAEWVLKEIVPVYDKADMGMTPEAVASITATLFIQACKSGKVE